MPLLFLERFPWPSLQTYTALSVALLAGSIFSAFTTVTDPGFGALDTDETPAPTEVDIAHINNDISNTELATTVLWYLVTDSLFVWVSAAPFGSFHNKTILFLQKTNCHFILSPTGFSQHILLLFDVNC